jgi:hypothetical protein
VHVVTEEPGVPLVAHRHFVTPLSEYPDAFGLDG